MQVYTEVKDNALNVCKTSNAPDAMTITREEDLNQPAQITDQADMKVEGNQSVSLRALKTINENAEKRLRIR